MRFPPATAQRAGELRFSCSASSICQRAGRVVRRHLGEFINRAPGIEHQPGKRHPRGSTTRRPLLRHATTDGRVGCTSAGGVRSKGSLSSGSPGKWRCPVSSFPMASSSTSDSDGRSQGDCFHSNRGGDQRDGRVPSARPSRVPSTSGPHKNECGRDWPIQAWYWALGNERRV